MRAKSINFERGLDPKQAMDLGNERFKKEVVSLLPQIEDQEKQNFLEFILDPTTQIKKQTDPEYGEIFVMTLPENRFNKFFFYSFNSYLNSRNPRNIRILDWDNEKIFMQER
jgi:hypothetical protein